MNDPCRKGLHDLSDPANVLPKSDGYRQCGPCNKAAREAARVRKNMERYGQPNAPSNADLGDFCAVVGCDRPRRPNDRGGRRRYCYAHSNRLANHGDLYADVPIVTGSRVPLAHRREQLAQ